MKKVTLMKEVILLCILCTFTLAGFANDDYEQRRQAALRKQAQQNDLFGHLAKYRLGVNVDKANSYFATCQEIDFDHPNRFVRAWYLGQPHLNNAARKGLLCSMRDFQNFMERRIVDPFPDNGKGKNGAPGGDWTENHQFRFAVGHILLGQILGKGSRHDFFYSYLTDMLHERLAKGFGEYNSPKYLNETLEQVSALAEWAEDENLRTGAQMVLDMLWSDVAMHTIRGNRASALIRDSSNKKSASSQSGDNVSYKTASYFFGFNNSTTSYAVVDDYRPPQVAFLLAQQVKERGVYSSRIRNQFHFDRRYEIHNFYTYVHPAFSISCAQNRMKRKNNDRNSNQTWEIVTTDPDKTLGAYYEYIASSNGNSQSTANMQYKNVLFYYGDFLDYRGNLAANGGSYETKTVGNKRLHFYRVVTAKETVFIGITDYPGVDAGIIEVRAASDYPGNWQAFMRAIEEAPSSCRNEGRETSYVSTMGDAIASNIVGGNGDDKSTATVNGKPFKLIDYARYESPYMNAGWQAQVATISYGGEQLILDYSNKNNFRRVENSDPTTPPKPPVSDTGVLQAEDADVGGGAVVESNHAGYRGSGFVNFPQDGGFVQFNNVEGGDGGEAQLTLRYALGNASRTGELIVNGQSQPLTTPSTGSWSAWQELTVAVSLQPGKTNTIRIASVGEDLANLDQIKLEAAEEPTPKPPVKAKVVPPVADAYVRGNGERDGSGETLLIKQGGSSSYERVSYLKFDLSGYTSAQISSATLRLYCTELQDESTRATVAVHGSADNWTEQGITWQNKPALGNRLGSSVVDRVGRYYAFNVSQYVQGQAAGDKTVSLALVDGGAVNKALFFGSRESGNPPQLVITTTNARQGSGDKAALALEEAAVQVYPNPSTGLLNITGVEGSAQRVQLVNLQGQVLLNKQLKQGQTQLDVSALPKGLYLVKVGQHSERILLE